VGLPEATAGENAVTTSANETAPCGKSMPPIATALAESGATMNKVLDKT
jgi:hypothetical protein